MKIPSAQILVDLPIEDRQIGWLCVAKSYRQHKYRLAIRMQKLTNHHLDRNPRVAIDKY